MEETQVTFQGPHRWTDDAQRALALTFHDESQIYMARKGIESGEFQLWTVAINGDVAGWLVTEKCPREIFVWAYQGRDSRTVLRALAAYAAQRKIPYVGCFTTHKSFVRMFRKFAPQVNETDIPGELRFRFNSGVLAHGA